MANDYIRREDAKDALQEKVFHNLTDEFYGAMQVLDELPPADVVPVNREKLMAVLRDFFSIGDSYTYELTRVKSAFEVGTMSLDDFEEWGEDNISDLCDYIFRELRKESEHG